MKVLHVMPCLMRSYGGPVTALIGYVSAAGVNGVESTVVGPWCGDSEREWLQAQMPGTTIVMNRVAGPGPWTSAPGVLPAMRRCLREADVVHVHGLLNPTSSLAARLAIAARRPLAIGPFGTMSSYTFSHRRAIAKRVYFRLFDTPNLHRAAALHFTTAAERAEAEAHGVGGDGRSYVVPPPYQIAPGQSERRSPGERPVVLFLGRLDPKKGVELVLDSWTQVVKAYPRAQLRIAGSGAERYASQLRGRATAAGWDAGSVQFLGFVAGTEKDRQLREAAVMVLPSQHENFGIAVLDAIAAGVPVVVTPGVQLAPWITEQRMGRVTDRSDSSIGAAIIAVLCDAALRDRVAACGRIAVAKSYSPSAVAPALAAMYQGALIHHEDSK